MRAGQLHHRIELQSITGETRNAKGEKSPVWTTFKTVYASVLPNTGDETMRGVSSESEITHNITIRYNATITPKHRVLWGSRVFTISNVLNKAERGIWQTIKAKEVV